MNSARSSVLDGYIGFVEHNNQIHVIYQSDLKDGQIDEDATSSAKTDYKEMVSSDGVNFKDTGRVVPYQDGQRVYSEMLYSYNGNTIGLSKEKIIISKNSGAWSVYSRDVKQVKDYYDVIQWTGREYIKMDGQG